MYRSDLLKRYIGIKTDLMTPQSNLAEMSLYVTLDYRKVASINGGY